MALITDSMYEQGGVFLPPIDQRLGPEHGLSEDVLPDAGELVSSHESLRDHTLPSDVIKSIALVSVPGEIRPWYLTRHETEDGRRVRSALIHLASTETEEPGQPRRMLFEAISLIGNLPDLSGEWHHFETGSLDALFREGRDGNPLTEKEIAKLRKLKSASYIDTLNLGQRFVIDGADFRIERDL